MILNCRVADLRSTMAQEFETELKNAADETTDKIEEKTEKLKDDIKK